MHMFVCVLAHGSISLRNSTTSRMREASIILIFWQKKHVIPPGLGGLTVLSCFVEYTYLSG